MFCWLNSGFCRQVVLRWIFHIPTGQCSRTLRKKNSCFAVSRDTGSDTATVMTAQQPWSESGWLSRVERTEASAAVGVSHTHSRHQSPQCTSGCRVTEVSSSSLSLTTYEAPLTGAQRRRTIRCVTWRLSTVRSSCSMHVGDHPAKKDNLSISCSQSVYHWSYINESAVLETYVFSDIFWLILIF